jgi:hypothetical protein
LPFRLKKKQLVRFSWNPVKSNIRLLERDANEWDVSFLVAERIGDYNGMFTSYDNTEVMGCVLQKSDGIKKYDWYFDDFKKIIFNVPIRGAVLFLLAHERDISNKANMFFCEAETGCPRVDQVKAMLEKQRIQNVKNCSYLSRIK